MPTILVIDDNPAVGTALETLFSLHDIETRAVGSPEEGLALLEREPVDLVVYDPDTPRLELVDGGRLADVAPTVLRYLGIDRPDAMTGRDLVSGRGEIMENSVRFSCIGRRDVLPPQVCQERRITTGLSRENGGRHLRLARSLSN